MPFVSVKCPSCGGDIELDDSREYGFCLYCGAKVMFKEAVQKVEGNVIVEGIANFDKLVENAKTFHKLGNTEEEIKILLRILKEYPADWRVWWKIGEWALHVPYDRSMKHFDARQFIRNYYYINEEDNHYNPSVTTHTYYPPDPGPIWNNYSHYLGVDYSYYIDCAIKLAPPEKALKMKKLVYDWLCSYLDYYPMILQELREDEDQASKDMELIEIERDCHAQASHKCYERFFKTHKSFDEIYQNELKKRGSSREEITEAEEERNYNLPWRSSYDYEKDIGSFDKQVTHQYGWTVHPWPCEICMACSEDAEESINRGLASLQKEIQKYK